MQSGSGPDGDNPMSTPEINKFTIAAIAMEATKFSYLLALSEPKYVENIWDLVTIDENNEYSLSKERLLTVSKESEECKIKKLLSRLKIDDMKPSQLLRKMRNYAGTNLSENALKTSLLNKLPSNS
ncbi:uncharacterized protein LOC124805613 [Schistocerca piceifrons]|uniref:uncharacterized protein LOC124805613 n=1 Tax=Schistocerca piceifrons TaxID=274613 RepID=UPI001F5F1A0F|nr:uncharacterized protein LOC124805613 [Schistocerca piceifrons]